jgi:hypothetical protein
VLSASVSKLSEYIRTFNKILSGWHLHPLQRLTSGLWRIFGKLGAVACQNPVAAVSRNGVNCTMLSTLIIVLGIIHQSGICGERSGTGRVYLHRILNFFLISFHSFAVWSSVVSYRDWMRYWRSWLQITVGARFSAPVHTGSRGHPVSYAMGTGLKRPGRGVNHTPLPSAKVKERVELWLCPPLGLMACCRAKFTFLLLYVILPVTDTITSP